jgi:putative ABC transport system substrate-binding protein
LLTASVTDSTQIESALSNTAQQPGGGLVVLSDAMLIVNRALIVDRAAQYRLPAVYPFRIYASAGGLVSYGLDILEVYRRAASYINRILQGDRRNGADEPPE